MARPQTLPSGSMDMLDTSDADSADDPERALLHRYVQGDAAAARLLTVQLTPRIFC
jgi:RNA polymerase sigma-70 factor (ECF subfamily)